MKKFLLILLFSVILCVAPVFAGTFYNPKTEKLEEKGIEAAATLNIAFSHFYMMLKNFELNKISDGNDKKFQFEKELRSSLEYFQEVYELATRAEIQLKQLTKEQKESLQRLTGWLYEQEKNEGKLTEKVLARIPVDWCGKLLSLSAETVLQEKDPELYAKLRKLILAVLIFQEIGLDVSALWEAYANKEAN